MRQPRALTEHEITTLATIAYEEYGATTDEALIEFLRADLPYRKEYADRRQQDYDNYHTRQALRLVALEAALLRRLEDVKEK